VVGIYTPADPIGCTWRGGSIMGSRTDVCSASSSLTSNKGGTLLSISKAEYFEKGAAYIELENRFTL